MRLALFTDTYDDINGLAVLLKNLVGYCAKTGKHLDIVTCSDNGAPVERHGSVRIFRYRPLVSLRCLSALILHAKIPRFAIFRHFENGPYDLIHVSTPGPTGAIGLMLGRRHRVPLIGSYHAPLHYCYRERVKAILGRFKLPPGQICRAVERLTWSYVRWFYDNCSFVMVPSESMRALARKKFLAEVATFAHGVDTDKFNPSFREEHHRVRALCVGRISAEKNLTMLKKVFEDIRDAELVLVGDGPYRSELQRDMKNARITGFLSGEDLSRAYASSDIFVFPSRIDAYGNVVLEAMSSGLPVILTDGVGTREAVEDGKTGFVVGSKEEFKEKLKLLIHNETLRKRMAKNARDHALKLSWDAVFEGIFQIYEKVLERNKRMFSKEHN